MMDKLKQMVADAARNGAKVGVVDRLGSTHDVEVVHDEKLEMLLRVRAKVDPAEAAWQPGPRYFLVKVSEPI